MSSLKKIIRRDNKRIGNNYRVVGGSKCKLENVYISQNLIGILGEELNDLYIRFAACKPSSSSIKRCFSIIGAIHTDTRNNLKPEKVKKLLNNLQLEISRKQTLNLSTHLAVFELLAYLSLIHI